MKKILAVAVSAALLTACGGGGKKVIVMSKGPAEINTDAKTIKGSDGTSHEEKEVMISGKSVFKLTSPAGEGSADFSEDGLYVVNVKNDTIVGGYQKYGDPKLAATMVTQDAVKKQIDSIQLLLDNKNVSTANRNFFILPNTAVKISSNTEAMVVGPYHRMRSAEKVDGKDPEVYRFYSIKEMRENLEKMKALTVAEKK